MLYFYRIVYKHELKHEGDWSREDSSLDIHSSTDVDHRLVVGDVDLIVVIFIGELRT